MQNPTHPTTDALYHRNHLVQVLAHEAARLIEAGEDPSVDWGLDRAWSDWFERCLNALMGGHPACLRFHCFTLKLSLKESIRESMEDDQIPLPF